MARVEESEITFGIVKSKEEKQRTEDWHKDRIGRWTGTKSKKVMSCGPGKSKLPWDDINRLFSFGETAVKIIYQNAMERKTNTWVNEGEGTYQMRYGTAVEPLIDRLSKEILLKKVKNGKLKSVGFKTFRHRPECGSSSDKVIVHKKSGKTLASVEYKACTTWDTHYGRVSNPNDSNSIDFWQMVNQVISHNVDVCYYVVASPPHDIMDYVFHQGDIMDLYKKFKKECNLTIVAVKPSEFHKRALLTRLALAEHILCDYLSGTEGKTIPEVIEENLNYFQEKQESLDKLPRSRYFLTNKDDKKCKKKSQKKKKKPKK